MICFRVQNCLEEFFFHEDNQYLCPDQSWGLLIGAWDSFSLTNIVDKNDRWFHDFFFKR